MTDRTAHDIASLHRRLGFTGEALGVWTHRPETGGDRFLTFRVEDVHRVIDEWAAAHPPATVPEPADDGIDPITKGGLDVERLAEAMHRRHPESILIDCLRHDRREAADLAREYAALEPTHD